MLFNFWRPSRYCSSSNHVEIGATRSVGSVPAVYQFLSVEQKSKVIFVPRSFFYFLVNFTTTSQRAVCGNISTDCK
ncbi:MAG: hypothetical protein E6Y17_10290 [Enterococcus faecalis]|nr:hypothetical protein [Enterococcus faecalis]